MRPRLLEAMIGAGMNVARINLSHGSHAEHAARIARVRAAAHRCAAPVGVMLDTRGPEVRTAAVADEAVSLIPGDAFVLHVDGRLATAAGTSVTHLRLPREVEPGATVLIDDGAIELRVVAVRGDAVRCEIVRGGELCGRKSLHVQGVQLSLESSAKPTRRPALRGRAGSRLARRLLRTLGRGREAHPRDPARARRGHPDPREDRRPRWRRESRGR